MRLYHPLPVRLHDQAIAAADLDPELSVKEIDKLLPGFVEGMLRYGNGLRLLQTVAASDKLHERSSAFPNGFLLALTPYIIFSTETHTGITPLRDTQAVKIDVVEIAIGQPHEGFEDAELTALGARSSGTWIAGSGMTAEGTPIDIYCPLPETRPYVANGLSPN
jgi:hypothetical protein